MFFADPTDLLGIDHIASLTPKRSKTDFGVQKARNRQRGSGGNRMGATKQALQSSGETEASPGTEPKRGHLAKMGALWRGAWSVVADHRAFSIVLLAAGILRLVALLAYPPAHLYWPDSINYLIAAEKLTPQQFFDPSGYGIFLLRPLMMLHSFELVVAVQHLLGLAAGGIVYAVLVRRRVPRWLAVVAAVPELFDASFFQLESTILSDTLFIFLMVAAVGAVLWSPSLSLRAATIGGLLFSMAAVTRTVALPLAVLMLGWLLLRRVGWKTLTAAAAATLAPVLLYAIWFNSAYGQFNIVGGGGIALYARTLTFADCGKIHPDAEEARLCPNGHVQDAAEEYVWAVDSPINEIPGRWSAHNNALAMGFAIHAIEAQPISYISHVAANVSLAFHWTPARHPKRVTAAFGWVNGTWPTPDNAISRQAISDFEKNVAPYHSVQPYAGFMQWYQYPAYLRGPFLAFILAVAALGLRRKVTVFPCLVAVSLLVLPVAALDFDHRYVLPVVPIACMAAALAASDAYRSAGIKWRLPQWRRSAGAPMMSGFDTGTGQHGSTAPRP